MNNWEQLEDDLRHELRHVPAPDGFAERVLARASAGRPKPQGTQDMLPFRAGWRSVPRGWWAAAAATVLLTAGGGSVHLHRVHEAERTQAEAQLTLALSLTNHALDAVQRDVDRSGAGRYTRILRDDATNGETR